LSKLQEMAWRKDRAADAVLAPRNQQSTAAPEPAPESEPESDSAPAPAPAPEPEPAVERFEALAAFVAQEPGDLGFKKGEVVVRTKGDESSCVTGSSSPRRVCLHPLPNLSALPAATVVTTYLLAVLVRDWWEGYVFGGDPTKTGSFPSNYVKPAQALEPAPAAAAPAPAPAPQKKKKRFGLF
jgi:hypothetical protein